MRNIEGQPLTGQFLCPTWYVRTKRQHDHLLFEACAIAMTAEPFSLFSLATRNSARPSGSLIACWFCLLLSSLQGQSYKNNKTKCLSSRPITVTLSKNYTWSSVAFKLTTPVMKSESCRVRISVHELTCHASCKSTFLRHSDAEQIFYGIALTLKQCGQETVT